MNSRPSDLMAEYAGLAAVAGAESPRPLLRGKFHLAAALAAPFGLVLLLMLADSPRGYVGASIFGASLILCYGVSATYHLVSWSSMLRGLMKRFDHSMIFVLIAGTYTPFCVVVLHRAWSITMLSVVWGVAGGGVLLKMAWPAAPRWLSVGAYLAVGWLALIPAEQLADWFSAGPLALLVLGGVLYSMGSLVYAAKRPDPFPRVFGYHEIFHLLVVAGSLIHFSLVAAYVLPS